MYGFFDIKSAFSPLKHSIICRKTEHYDMERKI